MSRWCGNHLIRQEWLKEISGNEDGGSRTLGNICQRCARGLLSCKAGTLYGHRNRGLGGVPYDFRLDISKHWGFSQHVEGTGE